MNESRPTGWSQIRYFWVEGNFPHLVLLRGLLIFRKAAYFGLARRPMPWGVIMLLYVLRLTTWGWWRLPSAYGERLKLALEDLGPIFTKLGQLLATRQDILSKEVAEPLAKLCDQVRQVDFPLLDCHLSHIYGSNWLQQFSSFDIAPIAAASIAQVHGAKLHSGEDVVVKILRPGVRRKVRRDLALMSFCARVLSLFPRVRKRLKPVAVVEEFKLILTAELDLLREGSNMSLIANNFANHPYMSVPKVYWAQTRAQVLVMERIYATNINDYNALAQQKVDFKCLAEQGVKIFLDQVFRDGFFHADMHHGNVFVDATNPNQPRYIAVDFGVVGRLSQQDRLDLALIMAAFFERDYERVAQMHLSLGWIPASVRFDEFAAAIRTVAEPIFAKNIGDVVFGDLILALLQVAKQFELRSQPQLLLLQKTFLNVESLGRKLYPQLNLWDTVHPYLRQWIRSQLGVQSTIKRSLKLLPDVMRLAPSFIEWSERKLNEQPKPQTNGGFAAVFWCVVLGLWGSFALVYWINPGYPSHWLVGLQTTIVLIGLWSVHVMRR